MPILVYLFAVSPVLATSYSLFIVGGASLVGVWRYHIQGLVDYRTALIFIFPSFFGTFLARQICLPLLPEVITTVSAFVLTKDKLVMIAFAAVMVAASFSMIRSTPPAKKSQEASGWVPLLKLMILGFVVGFIAGFVGAGGGFLIIPALVFFASLSMTVAVPTSLVIISMNSLVGFVGDLFNSVSVDWKFLAFALLSAIAGLFGGIKLSKRVSPNHLKVGFGWFVLFMGTWILLKQVF
jgi:uncharacterized membrane protein YfcA